MVDTWVVDLRHYLDEHGAIAPKSGSAYRLAQYFATIVREITADIGGEIYFARVRCRRKPKRKPCPGEIDSVIDPESGVIVWECPVCGDNGTIRGWEGTLWDLSESCAEH
jgi:hypothetical protein